MTQESGESAGSWRPTPTEVVAQRVQELRRRHGWSAQRLADECAAAGVPELNRSVIANLESGRRESVTLDEVFALAYVLDVAPTHLVVPVADEVEHHRHGRVTVAGYRITPTMVADSARRVRAWVRGSQTLPGVSKRFYEAERPDDDLPDAGQPPEAVLAYLESLRPEGSS